MAVTDPRPPSGGESNNPLAVTSGNDYHGRVFGVRRFPFRLPHVPYENITTTGQLQAFCRALSGSPSIAVDTEFVSEYTYRPVLCLIQVIAQRRLAVIDVLAVPDLTPFWEVLAAEGHETIVHAGRMEVEFCLQAIGRPPANVFDVQIAAGLAGMEYPAAYGTLITRLLGQPAPKRETRTDWRRRPLSRRQIDYALDDARHLPALRDHLHHTLSQLGRLDWLSEEMDTWLSDIKRSLGRQRWRRVSGNSGLDRRSLAIVRALWHWREAEAQRRNLPARRVLRDDLILELARRKTADPNRIRAVRGLARGQLRHQIEPLAASIRQALQLPEAQCPQPFHRERPPQLSVLGQFLYAALGSICRQSQLAPALVGTPSDIRELIRYRISKAADSPVSKAKDPPAEDPPRLARGWRAEFVGRLFDKLLSGKMSIRIVDPSSDHPLKLEPS